MLVGEGESSRIVYNSLRNDFDIKKVIEDTSVSKKIFLKRRVKKMGYSKVLGQILFIIYNKILVKISRDRIELIKIENRLNSNFYPIKVFKKVESINNEETIKVLLKNKPDIIIVNGTRILSKKILNAVDAIFINTHVGITPSYRGVHGAYWALVNRDYKNCGVTVHLVDEGIDTGGILYQDLIEITKSDNINTYPYLQIVKAIPLLKQAIKDVIKGCVKIRDIPVASSTLYTHPTLLEYFKNKNNGVK
jgi:folate-dependent phosphoribosylglycinamide formyltransferase PurN